jgi:hypothetical protein
MDTRYGGELQIGDFIAVAYSNTFSFGWYVGSGKGTIQFVDVHGPASAWHIYERWKAGELIGHWYSKRFAKDGFTFKLLYKNYVLGDKVDEGRRVIKIEDPESIFTNAGDLEEYKKSKEALIYIKFLDK